MNITSVSCAKYAMCISTFMNVLSQNSPSYLLQAEKTSSDQYLQFNSRQQRYPSQSPVRPSFQPQHPRQRYMGGPSPINIHSLKNCLVGYPSKYIATSLLNGIQKGFCLNFADLGIPLIQKKKLLSIIQKEVELGRMSGSFLNPPMTIPVIKV